MTLELESREEKMFINLYLTIEFVFILSVSFILSKIFSLDFYLSLFIIVIMSLLSSFLSFIWHFVKSMKEAAQ